MNDKQSNTHHPPHVDWTAAYLVMTIQIRRKTTTNTTTTTGQIWVR